MQPQFFLGDSYVYINSALTGSRPVHTSYWYGRIIHAVVGDARSLMPLLLFQALCGAVSSVICSATAKLIWNPRPVVLSAIAVICCVEPSQILMERYVMTESPSLAVLTLMVFSLARFLCGGSLAWFLGAAALSWVVVSLRVSLLPVVAIGLLCAVFIRALALPSQRAVVAVSGVMTLAALALLYSQAATLKTGQFVMAAWSPLLVAEDFPDPQQGAQFMAGKDLRSDGFFTREITLHRGDGLLQAMKNSIPDTDELDRVSKRIAANIFIRDPVGVLTLAGGTYLKVFDADYRLGLMKWDIGQNELPEFFRNLLRDRFNLIAPELPRPSFTSNIYLKVGYWTTLFALMTPFFLAVALISCSPARRPLVGLVCILSIALVSTIALLSTQPVVRYFQPLTWMFLAVILPLILEKIFHAFARVFPRFRKKG